MALALVLLTAGGLMVKSVMRLQATELGFDPRSLLTARVCAARPAIHTARGHTVLRTAARRGCASQPGHRRRSPTAAVRRCPDGCNGTAGDVPGPAAAADEQRAAGRRATGPRLRYFETLGIRLVRGRVFTDHDRAGQPKVVVINETAARTFWPNEDPIGKRIGVGQGGFGTAPRSSASSPTCAMARSRHPSAPDVYLPLLQSTRASGFIFVRSALSPQALVSHGSRRELRGAGSGPAADRHQD